MRLPGGSLAEGCAMQRVDAVVVMGVTCCGKSSVADALAERAGGRHIEGDAWHSPANIARMRAGIALEDADRRHWLSRLGALLADSVARGERPVLSCSALRRDYREQLRSAVPALGFVFLQLDEQEARRRLAGRHGHFMSADLIPSQFTALEPPLNEPAVLTLDATLPVAEIARRAALWWLGHD